MVNSVLTKGCCDKQKDVYYFVGSQLTKGNCDSAIALEGFGIPMCEMVSSIKKLSKGESFSSISSRKILLSNRPFLFSNSDCLKTINFSLFADINTTQEGQVFTSVGELQVVLDDNEILVNWLNFDNKPINQDFLCWNDIFHSWDFYSTTNSTTSMIFESENVPLEFSWVSPEEFIVNFFDDKFTANFTIENNEPVFVSVTPNGNVLYEDIFTFMLDGGTVGFSMRGVVKYNIITNVYIDTSENQSNFSVVAISDDTTINMFLAETCEAPSKNGCCC